MLPITKTINPTVLDTSDSEVKRQPVLVYNSRVDTLLNEITVAATKFTISEMATDWSLFMDDLNSKMFDKI